MGLKCNQCGIADAEVTHICPPPASSFPLTIPLTAPLFDEEREAMELVVAAARLSVLSFPDQRLVGRLAALDASASSAQRARYGYDSNRYRSLFALSSDRIVCPMIFPP